MDPWYKVVTPRKEVREGRSFNPDEFAIALEQVVAGTAPEDYRKPDQFFERTCFTRALRDHTGMVLRRLSGKTDNTAPVLTLITQFGGGKTHTLTTLYHLAKQGKKALEFNGVADLLRQAELQELPKTKVAVFVGNAWDPQDGKETPWIDIARQLAGDKGVELLGKNTKETPPGTEALGKIFAESGGAALVLFDEVLNFLNRHRGLAEPFHAFIQNLTVAMTGTTHGAAVISLPRSQVEMTESDTVWQEKITRIVRRVAKDLIANDEAEISEVVRRRLFENIGTPKVRATIAKIYADWCFERRAQLPPEWTAVDTAVTASGSRDFLQRRFEGCYPFHPATLSVFQRKWQPLRQYQQTRGTLAMLAQWINWAYQDAFKKAREEALITIGSAPLEVSGFQSVVLGQLGESKLTAAISADIAGDNSHATALDVDAKGPLRDIHKRVAKAILFESSGGQTDRVAHLPELRFALGEPQLDTTSIDNAAMALESRAFFISRVGSDGFKIYHKATIRKAVNDRRASLDEESEILPEMRSLVKKEFERGRSIPMVVFPEDASTIPDSPRLTLVLMDPTNEWTGDKKQREQVSNLTRHRGTSPRLYPGSLVWCFRKPGRDFRNKVEMLLAWRRVLRELTEGFLGSDYDKTDKAEIISRVSEVENAATDEVWAEYRYAVLFDNKKPDSLEAIDLGAGHSSGAETLCGRIIGALKSQSLLNESVGAGYLERNWPPALKASGAWPMASLRQSFLNGSLTRLLDPDAVLKNKIVEFVSKGDLGFASGQRPDGTFERLWFGELLPPDEITFENSVFLISKARATALRSKPDVGVQTQGTTQPKPQPEDSKEVAVSGDAQQANETRVADLPVTIRLSGQVPPELWNRLGTKIIPKLKSGGGEFTVRVEFSLTVSGKSAEGVERELRQILEDLGLSGQLKLQK